jgi:hypothetical protein
MLVLREFAIFVMAFFKITQNFSLLEATAVSGCVVESEKVLCAKLLILYGVSKVLETRYEIFGCLQTSALSSHPI